MESDEIENIFTSGFRSKSAVQNSKGSGLGLTVAKKIADASNVQLSCKYNLKTKEVGKFIIECVHKKVQEV